MCYLRSDYESRAKSKLVHKLATLKLLPFQIYGLLKFKKGTTTCFCHAALGRSFKKGEVWAKFVKPYLVNDMEYETKFDKVLRKSERISWDIF
jgi:hypothetical protein